jgi:membrane protein YqaA with SNARE-associated domain
LFGYWIGASAYDWLGVPILEFYGKASQFDEMRVWFNEVGNVAVFTAALTPIPYKLVTIASGAAGMNLPAFVASSLVGRGLRFFTVAGLLYWKGEVMGRFIDAHFEKLTVVFGVLLVGGFVAIKWLMH